MSPYLSLLSVGHQAGSFQRRVYLAGGRHSFKSDTVGSLWYWRTVPARLVFISNMGRGASLSGPEVSSFAETSSTPGGYARHIRYEEEQVHDRTGLAWADNDFGRLEGPGVANHDRPRRHNHADDGGDGIAGTVPIAIEPAISA
jgi:hypothetical protein